MSDSKKDKKKEDKTSSEASVNAGKKAIETNKKVSASKDDEKKDAEKWRNEG